MSSKNSAPCWEGWVVFTVPGNSDPSRNASLTMFLLKLVLPSHIITIQIKFDGNNGYNRAYYVVPYNTAPCGEDYEVYADLSNGNPTTTSHPNIGINVYLTCLVLYF